MESLYSAKFPATVFAGVGCRKKISEIFRQLNVASVAVFTDHGIENAGLLKLLTDQIPEDIMYHVYNEIPPEPSYIAVDQMISFVSDWKADVIVAIGGGSVMDAAKLCSLLKDTSYTVKDLLKDPLRGHKQRKTIVLPTTCGTGAEATCNAIVAVPEEEIKVGIVNDEMIPDFVLLDPELLRRLPAKIVAATGVDALAHVVECYTSRKATPLSDMYAAAGAKLIFHNIERAYSDPDDMEAKENMMIGAFCGGLAITASGTTAVHALSYPLGGKYHIAHGVSNAILFAPVMRCNMEACSTRLASLCDAVWPELCMYEGQWKAEHVVERISQIVSYTNIPTSLRDFSVPKEDLDWLVESGSKVTRLLSNNMKQLSLEDIRQIYSSVL